MVKSHLYSSVLMAIHLKSMGHQLPYGIISHNVNLPTTQHRWKHSASTL